MNTHLKIKRLSMAAEARIIKDHEQKALRHARTIALLLDPPAKDAKLNRKVAKLGLTKGQMLRLFRRIRERANAAPSEEHRAKHLAARDKLRHHRIHVLRPAARAAHLAHTYLKGRPYSTAEQSPRDMSGKEWDALWQATAKNIRTFGGGLERSITKDHVEEWAAGAEPLRVSYEREKEAATA